MIQKRIGGAHQTSLTTATFTEFVQAHRFVVIHFWATWNPYDDQMQILLGKLG